MMMPGRKYTAANSYRYGFNGKENDNEVKGEALQLDYGFRIYDPRLGRFLTLDPLFRSYPWFTPYQFAANKPINSVDLDGLEDVEITLATGFYPKIQKQAAELAKSNANQLAAMQQEAWNKVLTKIDAIVPKYFDSKHNLNGILQDKFMEEVDNVILNSEEAWQFNSLYNSDLDNYQVINPLLTKAATDLANDHYRASMCGQDFYNKYINEINSAKDPNSKAALIEQRSQKASLTVDAFQTGLYEGYTSFLDWFGYGKLTMSNVGSSRLPSSKYFNFSTESETANLRFVKNASGELEDLKPTFDRINSGIKFPHRNDGSIFRNSEGMLPAKPTGYYQEFVHPTSGAKGPGAQRIVVGQGGEKYYTPDHYKTFIKL